ncbi:MAG TPA: N-acetylmuramoyl-L-alanine amidase [Phycisphaerae bacterium]|nr:N-acetylmuramoyl-L-alanine amidase [Phycisphaerae bacterium]
MNRERDFRHTPEAGLGWLPKNRTREKQAPQPPPTVGRDWGVVAIFLATAIVVGAVMFGSCMAKIEAVTGRAAAARPPSQTAVPVGTEMEPEEVGGCVWQGGDIPVVELSPDAILAGCTVNASKVGATPTTHAAQPPIVLQADASAGRDGSFHAGNTPPANLRIKAVAGPGGRRFWRATIHHTATPPDNPAERVRSISADHRARGWDGIGYHFLIAEDGTVFPGRLLDRQGAHVKGENEGNLGIAFIGTYTDRAPPEAALAAVRRLLATWGFGPDAVYFHKDLAATECPGTWDKGVLF